MKATNYEALNFVLFTSSLLPLSITSKEFSAYTLFTKTHNINKALKLWLWKTHMRLYRVEGCISRQWCVKVNINVIYENALFISLHLLAYCVKVNPTNVSNNFGNSWICVLENFQKFIFLQLVTWWEKEMSSSNLKRVVLQNPLAIKFVPKQLK